MKKIILLISILLILTSCANKEVGLDINKNTSNNNIEVEINTGKTNSGSLNQEEKEIQEKYLYELNKHKDGNIYLYKNGKQIDYLTTKAFKKLSKECSFGKNKFYEGISYEIISGKGPYGVVLKKEDNCGALGVNRLYVINLDSNINLENINNKLTEIEVYPSISGIKLENGSILKYKIVAPGSDIEFKSINLNKIFSQINNNQIKTGEYSHDELIKNGYKINKLGDINEYYKKEDFDEDIWGNGIKFETIYIKGKKILKIDNRYYLDSNGKYIPKISISNGNDFVDINNTIIHGNQLTDILPIQPIFKSNLGKSKLIVDKNLDTVSIIYNGKTYNIWSKGKVIKHYKKIDGIIDITNNAKIVTEDKNEDFGIKKISIDTGKYGKYFIGEYFSDFGWLNKVYYNKKYNYIIFSIASDHVGSLILTDTYKIDLNNKKIEKLEETLGADFYFKSIDEIVPIREALIDDGYGKILYYEEGSPIKIK